MKKTIIGIFTGAGLCLVAAGALAKDHKADRGFDRLDINGDGVINAADAEIREEKRKARADKIRIEADANGDGEITREEFNAFREAKRAERNPDKNGDGVVDRAEFMAKAEERFDKLDKNGDGVLSEDEQRMRRRHGRMGRR